MTDQAPLHRDTRRAGSSGAAAQRYDSHRPRYPEAMIAGLVDRRGARVLDVGAGTGIASVSCSTPAPKSLPSNPIRR